MSDIVLEASVTVSSSVKVAVGGGCFVIVGGGVGVSVSVSDVLGVKVTLEDSVPDNSAVGERVDVRDGDEDEERVALSERELVHVIVRVDDPVWLANCVAERERDALRVVETVSVLRADFVGVINAEKVFFVAERDKDDDNVRVSLGEEDSDIVLEHVVEGDAEASLVTVGVFEGVSVLDLREFVTDCDTLDFIDSDAVSCRDGEDVGDGVGGGVIVLVLEAEAETDTDAVADGERRLRLNVLETDRLPVVVVEAVGVRVALDVTL